VEKYCIVRQVIDDNKIRRKHSACWITKAKDTHSEYVILIAFQLQQWLRQRASMLPLCIQCLYSWSRYYLMMKNVSWHTV